MVGWVCGGCIGNVDNLITFSAQKNRHCAGQVVWYQYCIIEIMKTILFAIMAIVAMSAIQPKSIEPTNTTAQVESYMNVSIFCGSRPVKEYTSVGKVTATAYVGMDHSHANYCRYMVKRALDKYPDAQGILIDDSGKKAEVIKFK